MGQTNWRNDVGERDGPTELYQSHIISCKIINIWGVKGVRDPFGNAENLLRINTISNS